MKPALVITAFFVLTFSVTAIGQNTVRLFEAVSISQSTFESAYPFRTADVYLSCPVDGSAQSFLTGPNGGDLTIDNFITVNDWNVCTAEDCFQYTADPLDYLGMPAESAYAGVAPIDISDLLMGSGIVRFQLIDNGRTFGSGEVYLHTSCAFETTNQVCHRNNGRSGGVTLTLPASAMPAHLAHGDSSGPCS